MKRAPLLAAMVWLCLAGSARGQGQGMEDILRGLDTEGRVTLASSGITIVRADFTVGPDTVEAIALRPAAEGVYPAVLLIPGYSRSARDLVPLGVRLAGQGFAGLAVTMPGFGRSQGAPDFCGPRTVRALEEALSRFRREPYVDSLRVGAYGYSRGALAAALLAVRPNRLRAAVLGAGIYDLEAAYREIELAGIRENIEEETGGTAEAFRVRSPLRDMESLSCPVLIIHGEKDRNAPVQEALRLRDRLTELGKPFEIRLFPDREHDVGMANVVAATLEFLGKALGTAAPDSTPASIRGDR